MIESTNVYLVHNHQWLMLLRNKKKNDVNKGKWIGVGGKREHGESIYECAVREVEEETGLYCDKLILNGILYFHYMNQESEKIWIYTCENFSGKLQECNEGTLSWIHENDILSLSLWDGDRIYLKQMLQNPNVHFCYEFYYDNQGNLIQYVEKELNDE